MMGCLALMAPSSLNPQGCNSFSPSAISGEKKKGWGTPSGNWYNKEPLGPYKGINFLLEFFSVPLSAILHPLDGYSGSMQ